MKAGQNYILITIDTLYEDKISGKSLKLDLASFDKVIVDKKTDDITYNNLEHKRIYGTVLAVPSKLTFNPDNPVIIKQIDTSLPTPEPYVSHEHIVKVGPLSPCRCEGECHCVMMLEYGCFPSRPEYKKINDIEMDVMVGDRVYFHYGSTEEENRLTLSDGTKIYKLPYQMALCVVRGEEIIPIAGKVLVQPLYDDNVENLGDGVMGIRSKSGLITQINAKAKTLEGIVKHFGKPLKGEEIDFEVGDHVIFKKHSDWKITVENTEYYCVNYWDIEGKFETI